MVLGDVLIRDRAWYIGVVGTELGAAVRFGGDREAGRGRRAEGTDHGATARFGPVARPRAEQGWEGTECMGANEWRR